jgi:hypothetical protein
VVAPASCPTEAPSTLSKPPAGAPAWFPEFLEAVAGQRFTPGADRSEFVPPESFLEIQEQLRASTSTDYYTSWARRWLFDPQPPLGQAAK